MRKISKPIVLPYNFKLNTRRGFKTIYYLMRLSQADMFRVIRGIIAMRRKGINEALKECDELRKENEDIILTFSLRGV